MKLDVHQLKWIRQPASFSIANDQIEIVTEPCTDLWQRTYYHFRNDNAPVLQMETDEKFFSFVVKTLKSYSVSSIKYWIGQKVPSVFKVKIKDTFLIFTKNFIEPCIHCFVPLPSAIVQATSYFHLPKTFYLFEQRTAPGAFYCLSRH